MAPVPPNTTNRYKVHYTGPFGSHTMLFHGVTGTTQATLRAAVAEVVGDMAGMTWNGTSFDRAEYSAAGSSFFVADPDWDAIVRVSGTNPAATDAPSHFSQFGGRSPTTGVRAKWYLFEDALRDNEDMRFTTADSGDVAAVVASLSANSTSIATIDGTAFSAYGYANVGQNDYLTHKARQ
jgi:hypothetical protein